MRKLRAYLLPASAELDPRFRRELLATALVRLRTLGAIAIGLPVLLATTRVPLVPGPGPHQALPSLLIAMCGAAILLAAKTRPVRAWPRLAAGAAIWLLSAVLAACIYLRPAPYAWVEYYLPAYFTAALLGAAAAIPFQPLQTAALGAALSVICLPLGTNPFCVPLLAVFATAVSAASYDRRIASWRERQEALRINECLALAQSRVLLSENAASLGRLAATLVHELNSPIGALTSGVETLMALSARQASVPPSEQDRLVTLQGDLRRSLSESLARLREIVSRIERFAALDEADFQCINPNELLRDVAALFETRGAGRVLLDLQPVPDLTCQPQQLSAVFASLLQHVSPGAPVRISSCQNGTHVEIRIEDTGKEFSSEELDAIFEPGFKVSGTRVSTGDWSLFGCRQIVQGHGGEIYVKSEPGRGATTFIRLPV